MPGLRFRRRALRCMSPPPLIGARVRRLFQDVAQAAQHRLILRQGGTCLAELPRGACSARGLRGRQGRRGASYEAFRVS